MRAIGYCDSNNRIDANQTFIQVIGYIPVVGLISGIFKFVIGSLTIASGVLLSLTNAKKGNEMIEEGIVLITRAFMETIGIGLVFLPFDLIATLSPQRIEYHGNNYGNCYRY